MKSLYIVIVLILSILHRMNTVSYDAFLKDLVEKTVVHADELSVIYSMEPTHSNIKGGLGIFGAEVVGSAPFYCKCYVFYYDILGGV